MFALCKNNTMKISLLNLKNSRVIYKVCEMFVYKHTETIGYVKR